MSEGRTPMECFEDEIMKIGVVAACEWFGHSEDSEFTAETIEILRERYPQTNNQEN